MTRKRNDPPPGPIRIFFQAQHQHLIKGDWIFTKIFKIIMKAIDLNVTFEDSSQIKTTT